MFSLVRDWEGKGQIKATLHFRDESRGSPEWQEWLVNSPPLSPPKKIEQNGVLYSGRIVLVISIFKLKLMQNTNLPHQCLNIFTNIYDMDIAVFGLLWMWLPLREKCSYSELFWSSFSRIWTECGPESLRIRTLFVQSTSCILWRRMHRILCEREQKCTSSWTALWSLKAISSYCVTVISNRIEPIHKHVHPIVLVPRKQNWGRAFDFSDRTLLYLVKYSISRGISPIFFLTIIRNKKPQ